MGAILDWVISPSFISLSYTIPCPSPPTPPTPNCNPIVGMGLDITQDFVNLILVFLLVLIALSIALRLEEYGSKKIFARLVIVALLVNFAPVIVGLIVDASNIVMNYFLSGIETAASDVGTGVLNFGWGVAKAIWRAGGDIPNRLGLIMQGVTQIIVNMAMGIAYWLFAGILLVRYVVIWALVILAPLAFVFWIHPLTKRFWDLWWSQLIQWSIIGIPIAFFLYLAMNSFATLQQAFVAELEIPGIEPTTVGWFNEVFPFFVIIIFLYLGFTIGLQTGAMGASATISYTKIAGKKAARFAGKQARILARRGLSKAFKGKEKEWMEKQAATRLPGLKGKGFGGIVATGFGYATGAIPAYWAVRRGIGEAGLRLTETERKEIRTAEEEYKGTTAERKASAARDIRLGWSNRVAALRQAVEEEQVGDFKKLLGPTADEEIIKIGRAALRTDIEEFKKIRNAFPQLAEKMGEGFAESVQEKAGVKLTSEDIAAGYRTVAEKTTIKIPPAHIPKMDMEGILEGLKKRIPECIEVEAAIHHYWTGRQVGTATSEFGKPFLDRFLKVAQRAGMAWYKTNNPKLATYLKSSAAQGLGLGPIP